MEAPIFIGELELTKPISDIVLPERADDLAYTSVHLLVRLAHVPVGFAYLEPHSLDAATIAKQVWLQLSTAINKEYARTGSSPLTELPASGLSATATLEADGGDRPLISVVVCTRNHPESVMATLRSLLAMRYQPFEVVVVDNAPDSEATRDAIQAEYGENPNVRYVREMRPGLSRARNCGLAEAAGEIVAFTDDDVTVDPWWLHGILRGFRAAQNVTCVTGMVATAKLENSAQLYFHLREAWADAFDMRVFDLKDNRDESPLYPYSPGIFGVGANFAVTRALMKEIGPFNEGLGAGTVSGGGEDLEIFMRIILSGNRLVHEPAAVVWHYHRDDLAELTDQMFRYGAGCTAALTAILMRAPRARRELPLRVARGIMRIFTLNDRVKNNNTLPSGLMGTEIRGLLTGPLLYFKARRKLRRHAT